MVGACCLSPEFPGSRIGTSAGWRNLAKWTNDTLLLQNSCGPKAPFNTRSPVGYSLTSQEIAIRRPSTRGLPILYPPYPQSASAQSFCEQMETNISGGESHAEGLIPLICSWALECGLAVIAWWPLPWGEAQSGAQNQSIATLRSCETHVCLAKP